MYGGVRFHHNQQFTTLYFDTANAALPVRLRSHDYKLMPWGRRPDEVGDLPPGGWVRQSCISHGDWDCYFPQPVIISVEAFMEFDNKGRRLWYPLTRGTYLQGMIAREKKERRVYIVTTAPDHQDYDIHPRWPHVINVA